MNKNEQNILLEALKEIAKGKGAYNINKLKHASNTIDNMKNIAIKAIDDFTTSEDPIKDPSQIELLDEGTGIQ